MIIDRQSRVEWKKEMKNLYLTTTIVIITITTTTVAFWLPQGFLFVLTWCWLISIFFLSASFSLNRLNKGRWSIQFNAIPFHSVIFRGEVRKVCSRSLSIIMRPSFWLSGFSFLSTFWSIWIELRFGFGFGMSSEKQPGWARPPQLYHPQQWWAVRRWQPIKTKFPLLPLSPSSSA